MTSTEITRYNNPIEAYWNELLMGWNDFMSRNNILLMNISDALFDAYCEAFCNQMKHHIHEYLRNYPEMARKNRQQSI